MLVLVCVAALSGPQAALAARTVYFADPGAGQISQFAVGPGGALAPLEPPVAAPGARRLAMTPAWTRSQDTPSRSRFIPTGRACT